MHKLMILNGSGDESVEYDQENFTAAQEKFAQMTAGGLATAFALGEDGNYRKTTVFDPTAKEVILVGPYVGG